MLDSSQPDLVQRMVNVNDMIMHVYDQTCLDAGYMSMINQLRNTSWASSASEGGRQWTYQTCVEFGFFQSSNDSRQPFGNNFPASYEDILMTSRHVDFLSSLLDFSSNNVRIFMDRNSIKCFSNEALILPMTIMVQRNFKVHESYSLMEPSILGMH